MISNGIMTVGPASSSTQTQSSVQSPTTTSNQNSIQQQANSLPSQSSNSYFKTDKSSYMAMANPNEMATISGKINANGGVVVLIIAKPDGTTEHITADVTNVGDFRTLIIIDSSFPKGMYTVNGSYQGSDLGSVTFTVD
ncbi:hypothetical protein DYY66_2607 [Candidatus Nitrosotalea sp. FS]|nr:hypothetical protein [Candidatus Nitrosotalea sp. FS]